jgi:DnaJ like chaperone protein
MASKFSFNGLLHSISKMISDAEVVEKKAGKSPVQKAHDDEIQEAIFVLAASVIRCNRNYTSDTETFIYKFMAQHFGAAGMKVKMESVNTHIDTGTEPYTRMACKELNLLTTYDSKLNIINFLLGVADADDYINAKELRVIARIAGYLGINNNDFAELKLNFSGKNNPYFILGIEESASISQVKAAYRKMTLKYHPDKMKEKDGGVKFRQIQKAFETIRQIKGA